MGRTTVTAMVRVQKKIAVLILLVTMIFACTDDKIKQAAKAADDLSQGISAAITLKQQLAQQGHIQRSEEEGITKALLTLNDAGQVFQQAVKSHTQWDNNTKAALAATFTQVTKALQDINTSGVLHLKDVNAERQLEAAIATISSTAAIVQGVLQ